mmetsp:Transcript_40144/g.110541  ORF Transcript_40144/g.110541 Transcript_40144/m.110541 type:complete len:229 (+) Transcript_40144:211-897(+)
MNSPLLLSALDTRWRHPTSLSDPAQHTWVRTWRIYISKMCSTCVGSALWVIPQPWRASLQVWRSSRPSHWMSASTMRCAIFCRALDGCGLHASRLAVMASTSLRSMCSVGATTGWQTSTLCVRRSGSPGSTLTMGPGWRLDARSVCEHCTPRRTTLTCGLVDYASSRPARGQVCSARRSKPSCEHSSMHSSRAIVSGTRRRSRMDWATSLLRQCAEQPLFVPCCNDMA